MFGDAFNTAGFVIDSKMHAGFDFEVLDLKQSRSIVFKAPAEFYDLLDADRRAAPVCCSHAFAPAQLGEIGAATSTQRLSLIAGRYVGKDDPVMIVRTQSGLPAVGEALEPFAYPHLVGGWMRGSHFGPLMPCSVAGRHARAASTAHRAIRLPGLSSSKDGKLTGPRDMFADPGFDRARQMANEIADYLRRMGPFEPHRAGLDELEYTTMPSLIERFADRWVDDRVSEPVASR